MHSGEQTYGGVALMFDDGTGTGEATDNLTQQPLFFNGQSDGQWHHMTADLREPVLEPGYLFRK